jgi:DNA-binding response OmpR family regulator
VSAARVLMIEDEPEIRRFVRMALQSEGLEFFEAATLQCGHAPARTHRPGPRVHVANLRKKLEVHPNRPQWLVKEAGVDYRPKT